MLQCRVALGGVFAFGVACCGGGSCGVVLCGVLRSGTVAIVRWRVVLGGAVRGWVWFLAALRGVVWRGVVV